MKIDKKTNLLAKKIKNNEGKVKVNLKTKLFFSLMKLLQKKGWNKADCDYWKEKGWIDGKSPWKK